MKRISLLVLIPLLAACSTIADDIAGPTPDAIGQVQLSASTQDLRDRYIVVLNSDAVDAVSAAAGAMGGTVHFRYRRALNGFAATLPAQALSALQRNPNVDYIVADGIATTAGAGSDNTVSSWGLDRIDQRNRPLSNSYEWTHDGTGVHAYILDTGIRTSHTAFGGRASVGFDAIGDGQNGNDCNGHGTHVAGTVGGAEYGVARGVQLVAVRVLNCAGSGSWSQVIAGVDWVASHRVKPAVANMSLSGGGNSALDAAVSNAVAAGVTFAVAAGNSSANACNYSPARAPTVLTVGSTTSSDARSSFSNYGTCVDIFAPGSSITSAWNTSNAAVGTISGTSMASPHVAGVAALYLDSDESATAAEVASAIVNSSTPDKVTSAGSGSPNRLLYSLFDDGGTPPPPSGDLTLVASGSKTRGVQQVSLTWSPSTPSETVTVRQDGNIVATTANDGSHSYSLGKKGGGSYQFQVCVVQTGTCSNVVTVNF